MKPLDEAVDAVQTFGFTTRQARFLALVMRHTGLCLPRQYAAFSGTSYGRKVNDFFARLVDDGWASSWPCVHNRARLYHVHHKALYRAIGDADSRFRRAVSARAAAGRIERLDALLAVSEARWLASVDELTQALSARAGSADGEGQDLARLVGRWNVDEAPLFGVDKTGRIVLVHVMTRRRPSDCVALVRPAFPLLRRLSRWSIHLALTAAQTHLVPDFVRAVTTAFEPTPDRQLGQLRAYFDERRLGMPTDRAGAIGERFRELRRSFPDGRCDVLYKDWLDRGTAVVKELASTVLRDAYATFDGTVQTHLLPRTYRHLDPLLQPRRRRAPGVGTRVEEPDAASTPLSTPASTEDDPQVIPRPRLDAPRMRLISSGLRIGGHRGGPRRITTKQPSLFAPGGKERV